MMFEDRRWLWLALVAVGLLCGLTARAEIPRLHEDGGDGRRVVVVPVHGEIDLGLASFVRRVLGAEPDAVAIVLDVDTFGGRVDAAVQIRDALLATEVPTVAYVHPRAISAGALVSYAADTLVFAPGASMGAATPIELRGGEAEPVDEKFTSYMRAEMRATAEATGRRADVAEAMVDRTLSVDGIDDGDKLLTVTTEDAVRIGLADGTAASLDGLLESLGLDRAARAVATPNWAESLAGFVTAPAVSGILMSLGMLGLMLELYHPGLSLPGLVGVVSLALFFGGHLIADLAGWEEAVLLGLGAVCLLLEVFVIPGFGIAGVLGIGLVGAGLVLSLVGMPLGQSWELGMVGAALGRVVVSMAGTVVGVALVARFVPAGALPGWLVLRARVGSDDGDRSLADEARAHPDQAHLLGVRGVAVTDLRPSGKARLDGQVVDVVSRHEYLRRGSAVVVVEVEGVRVAVEQVAESSSQQKGG